jgi:hypothetical protein
LSPGKEPTSSAPSEKPATAQEPTDATPAVSSNNSNVTSAGPTDTETTGETRTPATTTKGTEPIAANATEATEEGTTPTVSAPAGGPPSDNTSAETISPESTMMETEEITTAPVENVKTKSTSIDDHGDDKKEIENDPFAQSLRRFSQNILLEVRSMFIERQVNYIQCREY